MDMLQAMVYLKGFPDIKVCRFITPSLMAAFHVFNRNRGEC